MTSVTSTCFRRAMILLFAVVLLPQSAIAAVTPPLPVNYNNIVPSWLHDFSVAIAPQPATLVRYGLVRPLAHASPLSEVPTQGEIVPALAADLAPAKPDSYVLIKYEDFEGVWPNSGWSVTGCENHPCWDDDNYQRNACHP